MQTKNYFGFIKLILLMLVSCNAHAAYTWSDQASEKIKASITPPITAKNCLISFDISGSPAMNGQAYNVVGSLRVISKGVIEMIPIFRDITPANQDSQTAIRTSSQDIKTNFQNLYCKNLNTAKVTVVPDDANPPPGIFPNDGTWSGKAAKLITENAPDGSSDCIISYDLTAENSNFGRRFSASLRVRKNGSVSTVPVFTESTMDINDRYVNAHVREIKTVYASSFCNAKTTPQATMATPPASDKLQPPKEDSADKAM